VGQRRQKGRNVNGIILLDKPKNISSNGALQVVKKLFSARKAGHTGSLDPLATGMLPLCFGDATKFSAFLLDADKKYRTTVKLGVTTTTGDAEGEVIETRPVCGITFRQLENVLSDFKGDIQQIPPMYSALKVNGVKLYTLARQGIEIERKPRNVSIFDMTILGFEGDELSLDIHCSKGTYIRVLAEDIGKALGCGGHVQSLHRQTVGPFPEAKMLSMDRLESLAAQGLDALDAALLPVEYAISDWPEVNLTDDLAFYIRRGQAVFVPRSVTEGWVKLISGENDFMGIGQILEDGKVAPRRLINAN